MGAKIILAMVIACFCGSSFAYIVDGSRISRPRMLSFAQSKLQNQGTIEQTASGDTYLKISAAYIQELFKQIQIPGYAMPTASQVQIINQDEARGIKKLQELGQTIQFRPLGFYTIMEDNLEYFILAIDAPELSRLRTKYGLTDQLDNHAFTLTIAVREVSAHNELGKH